MRIAAHEFADIIRPYDTNTDPHPGRIAANKFADMIRPFVGGLPPTFRFYSYYFVVLSKPFMG
jgi:hypothetical protein